MNWRKMTGGMAAAILLAGVQLARGAYSGSGTFTKIATRADLVDGYYVVASSNGLFAMTHTNNGTYFTNSAISPSSGTLTDPSPAIVWSIQTNATYGGLTIFNEASNKYVTFAGTANAAYVASAVNGTTGVWSFAYGAGAFDVANAASTTRLLQYNSSSPRFACYSSVQQKLSLYKMDSSATAPAFTSGTGPYNATSGVAMAFTVTASGSPTPTLALQSTTASAGYSFTAGTGQLGYTPPQADGGATQTFIFTASNSAGVATQTVSVAVTAGTVPSFTSGAAYGATSGVAMAFTVTASGTPAPALALQSATAAGSYSFTAGTGQLNYTPATNDVGTQNFVFTASNVAGVVTQTVVVTVANIAVVPTFTSGTSYGATSLVAMAFTVTASGNPSPVLALRSQTASAGYSFTAGTGVLDYTPPTNDVGTQTFTFTASNSAGVATQTVSVAVAAALTAIPTVTITNITTNAFTVNWTACTGATNYQVQVATDTNFTAGGGTGTNALSEDFATQTDTAVPSGWSTDKSSDLDYTSEPYVGAAAPGYKFATTGQWLLSPTFATGATNVQFWAYGNGGSGSTIAVSALVSGVWTLMNTVTIAANDGTYNVALNPQTTQLKFLFTKTYNCGFDDVVVQTQAGGGSVVADATVAGLTYTATGLVMETTYYVRARMLTTGEWSTVVSATTASPTPTAPVFGANPGPLSVTTGVARTFTVAASGYPAATLALQSTSASSGYSFTAGTGQMSYTAPAADVGAQTFTFTASNASGVATQTVSVTVVAVAPAFGANPGPVTATATLARVFTVTATGNPSPTLALSGSTATSGYSFTAGTGQLSYTPPEVDVGARTFTFTASNVAGIATQVVNVTVAAAPSFIPTVSVTNIGTNSFTINWTEVTDASTYEVQIGSDTNFSGATTGTNILSENFSTLTATNPPAGWTSSTSSSLAYTSEPYVGLAAPAYMFSVNGQTLTSPVFASGATNLQFWAYGLRSGNSVTISGLVSGVWTAISTVSVSRSEATYNIPLNPLTTQIKMSYTRATGNMALDDVLIQGGTTAGSLLVDETVAALTYGATDLDLLTTYYMRVRSAPTGTWSSVVQATTLGTDPVVPWFTSSAGPYSTTAGVSVAFTVSAMGVPTPTLMLQSSTATASSYAFTTNTGYLLYTPPVGDAGTQTFTFLASNSTGVATQTVSVAVTAATAPVFDALGTQYATTGVTKVFTVSASGAPQPELALGGTTATSGYSFSPDTGRLSYTPPTNDVGPQTFTFTASNIAAVATQAVSVVVSNVPATAPVIDVIPPQATMSGLTLSYTVTATDPDTAASNLTFACTSAVSATVWTFNTNSGAFTFTPTTNQLGTNVFSFQATDHPTSLTSPWSNMVVVVSAAGDAVAVSFGSARIVGEEGGASVAIPVKLAYSGSAAVQFRFIGPTNGTAQRGVDFNCATTLVISGASTSNLMVDLVNDVLPEGPESIKIQLVPVSPATAGSTTQAVLYVRDDDSVSVMAANITSGSNQEYEDDGNRILQALSPDVVLIQEFNMTNGTTAAAYRAWVDANFGTNYSYYVQSGVSIPNGIVSRWPISSAGVWDDTTLTDRDFVWAKIVLPGTQQLQAVSVHIKASSTSSDIAQRTTEARALTNYIAQAGWLTNGNYITIAGDFNLYSTNETALQVLTTQTVTDKHQPADQFGDKETNSARDNPYDRVLPSTNLDARHRTFSLWGYTYTNGIVFDTRITWASGLPPPSLYSNSAALNMQHMGVMKVFELEKDAEVDAPQALSAAPAGATQIDVSFTRNAVGDDVIVVWNNTGTFTAPTGTAPAVGASFAGGTVLYKGSVSPQSHTGLTSCATYYYKCWSYAGTVYSSNGLTATATTTEATAPAAIWASATNATSFTAAWSAVAGATNFVLDVSGVPSFAAVAPGWVPVFRETMGTSAGTTTLADHEATNGFDNDAYTMSSGGADSPADVRTSSTSTNYTDPEGNVASAGANIYFTTTGVSGAVGFGIEGIDTRGYTALSLSFGYRKEMSTSNMQFAVEWSTNSGAAWNAIALSNMPAENASGIWYMVSNLTVSAGATGATNLSLRWVRASNSPPGRIDDILLEGYAPVGGYVAGYSNRTVSGATSQSVTGLTAGASYFFRVAALAGCVGDYSGVAGVTTLAAPAFGANPGPVGTTVGVAIAFSVSASGSPAPTLALQGTTASSGYSFTAGTGQLTYTPTSNDVGARTFTFIASNSVGVATQTVSVTVADLVFVAPTFNSGTSYGATSSVATAFTVTATGYPDPALALQGATASGGYGFTPATGQLAYTPPEADVGTRTFTFTASNALGVATQTVSVAVVAGIPAPPASLWASATNITGFTAAWSSAPLATSYRLDVSTSATFQVMDAAGTSFVLASNPASSPAVITNGWSGWNLSLGSSNYVTMTQSTSVITSPAFSTMGFTNLTVDFQTRTFGGSTRSNITVSISTNDGANWLVMGVVYPTNGSVWGAAPTLTNTANLGYDQTRIRWQSLDAATNIGVGVSNLVVAGWAPAVTPVFVPGYSNLAVAGTSQAVTGLTANSTYYFRVRSVNASGTGASSASANVTTLSKANQTISFPALGDQVTTNSLTLAATATSGLTVSFAVASGPATISGGTSLTFSGAGAVSIVASQPGNESWNAAANVTSSFTVTKASAGVTLIGLAQTYDGSTRTVTATTMPAGLTVAVTYDGGATAPVSAGSYAITGTVSDAMYQGAAAGTLVVSKAAATVMLGSLAQVYNGTARTASATTLPAGLTVVFTYDGGASAPVNAGTYAVTGAISDVNYAGSAAGSLVVSAASQTIDFPVIGDQLATNVVALSATASSGLAVSFAVASGPATLAGGTTLSFTGAGTVSIVASQTGDGNWNAAPPVTNSFSVTKAVAGVVLGNLAQAYDGTAKSATATTDPEDLTVDITYDGNAWAPTNAGSYFVAATINDAIYQGSATGTLMISQATQSADVTLQNLAQTYDGTPRAATATTDPEGLEVEITYDGGATAPVAAGSYTVVGTVKDINYAGAATGTLVVAKAAAGVTITNLNQDYDGTPKSVTVTTVPSGLAVSVTYNDSGTVPAATGSYVVVAAITEANYSGSVTGTLTIASAFTPFQLWVRDQEGQRLSDTNFTENADFDRDGMTTWEEYLADTDPATNSSVFVVTGRYTSTDHQLRISFPASTSRYYRLECCTNLTNAASITVSNIGWGVPGMVITNAHYTNGRWFWVLRSGLSAP